jgi:hypothetical protein
MFERSCRSRFLLLSSVLLLLVVALPALADDPIPVYQCEGFAEPMNHPHLHIGRGRVLPLRAKLTAEDGTFGDATTLQASPIITLKYQPQGKPAVDKTSGLEVRDYGKGNSFVWDQEAHWKFDLGTGNLPDDGKYVVTMSSGDETEYRVDPPCTLEFELEP